ncbi:hypothetical protein MCOR25_003450 [Pyricularia grisea]|nr:hypothetical protein MCOR25_003450 [Pyricularia grisea]
MSLDATFVTGELDSGRRAHCDPWIARVLYIARTASPERPNPFEGEEPTDRDLWPA